MKFYRTLEPLVVSRWTPDKRAALTFFTVLAFLLVAYLVALAIGMELEHPIRVLGGILITAAYAWLVAYCEGGD
jgi:hypothetical protein